MFLPRVRPGAPLVTMPTGARRVEERVAVARDAAAGHLEADELARARRCS